MSEFVNKLKRAKWDSIVIAVLTVALGLVCVCLPTESASVITTIFGIALIAMGITLFVQFCFIGGFVGGNLLVLGIAMMIVGIFALSRPTMIQSIVTVLFGVYIFVDSLTSMTDSLLCASAHVPGWVLMFVTSIITAIAGIVLMFADFEWVMVFAGVSLIVEGVRRFVITLTMSGKVRQAKKIIKDAHTVDEDDYTIY